jgi:hypothetical protein
MGRQKRIGSILEWKSRRFKESFLSFSDFYAIIAVNITEMSGEMKWKQVK